MPNDERKTPAWLFKLLDDQFHFTVDAASTDNNALVGNHWTKETDGLSQDWDGRIVWCNPPYSRGQLRQWVGKAIGSPYATTLMLIPGDCSTLASQMALRAATAILFLDRRLAFDDETAGAKFCNWLALFHGNAHDVTRLRGLNLGVVLSNDDRNIDERPIVKQNNQMVLS